MKRIAVFDFDGTISQNDTLWELFRFTHGLKAYLFLGVLSPVILAFKLGLVSNERAKEIVFSFFYKGWDARWFTACCRKFAATIRVRKPALEAIRHHQELGEPVVIVSASMEDWVSAWGKGYGIDRVLATCPEVKEGRLTGKFAGRNCYGVEKVRRLTECFPQRSDYYFTAYGDSRGDKELLAFADEGYRMGKQSFTGSKWLGWGILLCALLVYYLPFICLGENSFIRIHDNLDFFCMGFSDCRQASVRLFPKRALPEYYEWVTGKPAK